MAPHRFRGTIMQLLAFIQTLLEAHNRSNVASRGTRGGGDEEEMRSLAPPRPIADPGPPHQSNLSARHTPRHQM